MTCSIAALAKDVGGAVGDLQSVVSGLGKVDLGAREIRTLRELYGVGVERYPIGNRCELARPGRGENLRVRIRSGIPRAEDRFYQCQAVGRVIFGGRRSWADLFALRVLMPSRVDADDLTFVDPAPEWITKHYPRLHALAAVLRVEASGVAEIPEFAVAAARAMRQRGDFVGCEDWLRVAEEHAGAGDVTVIAAVQLNRGLLLKERDGSPSLSLANAHIRSALDLARTHGLTELHRKCAHDLAALAIEGRSAGALTAVREAFALYGPGHPLVPRLIHDLGHLWVEEGLFSDAARVLTAVLPRATDASTRGSILGSLARAVAALGDRDAFHALSDDLAPIWAEMPAWEAACALLSTAEGAAALNETTKARECAMSALSLARTHGLAEIRRASRRLLRSLRSHHQPVRWIGARHDTDACKFAGEVAAAFAEP